VIDGIEKHQTPHDQINKKFDTSPSLEAQVINAADQIAYQNHDIDDIISGGLLSIDDLPGIDLWKYANHDKKPKNMGWKKYLRIGRNKVVKKLIDDLYKQTAINIKKHHIKTLKDVYNCPHHIVDFSDKMKKINLQMRNTVIQVFYSHPEIIKQAERGKNIIDFLFHFYLKNPPKKLIEKSKSIKEPLHIIIKDYIAGMTDSFAEKQFKE